MYVRKELLFLRHNNLPKALQDIYYLENYLFHLQVVAHYPQNHNIS